MLRVLADPRLLRLPKLLTLLTLLSPSPTPLPPPPKLFPSFAALDGGGGECDGGRGFFLLPPVDWLQSSLPLVLFRLLFRRVLLLPPLLPLLWLPLV